MLLENKFGQFHLFPLFPRLHTCYISIYFKHFYPYLAFSHLKTDGCCSVVVQVVHYPLLHKVQHVVLDETSVEEAHSHKRHGSRKKVQK